MCLWAPKICTRIWLFFVVSKSCCKRSVELSMRKDGENGKYKWLQVAVGAFDISVTTDFIVFVWLGFQGLSFWFRSDQRLAASVSEERRALFQGWPQRGSFTRVARAGPTTLVLGWEKKKMKQKPKIARYGADLLHCKDKIPTPENVMRTHL